MFSPSDIRKGRILASGYYYQQYRKSDQEWDDKAWLTLQIATVWGADKVSWAFVYRGGVWAARAALTSSVAPYVYVPVVIGAVVSYAVDGEEGVFNYADFLEDVITLDDEGIEDKMLFTWEVLVEGKHRPTSPKLPWARDPFNPTWQETKHYIQQHPELHTQPGDRYKDQWQVIF